MAGMKLVSGIIKLPNQEIEVKQVGVNILAHPVNAELLRLYVETGVGSSYKTKVLRPKEKDYVNIKKTNLVRVPNDFIEGNVEISGHPKAICTVAHMCQKALIQQKDTLKASLIETEKEKAEAVRMLHDFLTAIQNTGTHSEKVLAIQSEYEGIMKKLGLIKDEK